VLEILEEYACLFYVLVAYHYNVIILFLATNERIKFPKTDWYNHWFDIFCQYV